MRKRIRLLIIIVPIALILFICTIILIWKVVSFVTTYSDTTSEAIIEYKSDEEVIRVIDDSYMMSLEDMTSTAHFYFNEGDYKVAYNLYDQVLDRMSKELDESELDKYDFNIAFYESRKADCYYLSGNTKKAKELIDVASIIAKKTDSEAYWYYVKTRQAIIHYTYYEENSCEDSQDIIELLEGVAEYIPIEEDEYYDDIAVDAYDSLVVLYIVSLTEANPKKAKSVIERKAKRFDLDHDDIYTLANILIDEDETDEAIEKFEELKNSAIDEVYLNLLGARISIALSDFDTARDYLDDINTLFISGEVRNRYNMVSMWYYDEINDLEMLEEYIYDLLRFAPFQIYNYHIDKVIRKNNLDVSIFEEEVNRLLSDKYSITLELRNEY